MWPAYCLARLGGGVGKFRRLAATGGEGRGGVALWWGRERLGKLPPAGSLGCPEEQAQKLGNSGGQVPEESSEPLRLHSWKLLP